MHARKYDHVGLGLSGFLGEAEAIADIVGDVLDVGILVVVGQDYGVPFFFEAFDAGEDVFPLKHGALGITSALSLQWKVQRSGIADPGSEGERHGRLRTGGHGHRER